jgi:thioredoxin-dependent peroxiredoxin
MPTRIVEGRKAPNFSLEDAGGKRVSLADFKGKDVVVLGVSADGAASHQKFAAKYKLPFPLLSDPDRKVMTAWGAYGDKMMYGKKTKGVIRSTVWIGPDGVVRKHWARVADAAKHPAQVLEQLRGEAPAGK